jgi:HAMP domain-containing protein
MKLLLKFNLIFAVVFAAGLGVAGYVSYQFLQQNARTQVTEQARLMMETALSARKYTTSQIKPLLQNQQAHERTFLPQTVPAYAATESFAYVRTRFPDYEYKEATLNPTNLRDRAVDWEADVINTFRNRKATTEMVGERETPSGKALFLARPIKADKPCLECHDVPRIAPAAMIKRYGSTNGFGWQENEIVGAQIVSVPMSVAVNLANAGFRQFMTYLGIVFLVTLVILDLVLIYTVARPIRQLSALADEISMGKLDTPELPAGGSDEIAMLAGSFNRMRRSLVKAMSMFDAEE